MSPQLFLLKFTSNEILREWKTSAWILKSLKGFVEEVRFRQVSYKEGNLGWLSEVKSDVRERKP